MLTENDLDALDSNIHSCIHVQACRGQISGNPCWCKMNYYRIYIGDYAQHTVRAFTEKDAIGKWLNDQGYDSADEAASEYELNAEDISAMLLDIENEI